MFQYCLIGLYFIVVPIANQGLNSDNTILEFAGDTIIVKKSTDFEISGKGTAFSGVNADWITIPQGNSAGDQLLTKLKVLF